MPVSPRRSSPSSTPARRSPASASSANESSPTAPQKRTCAPRRAAATAWFAPFPPGTRSSVASVTVSPGRGRRPTRAPRSRSAEPTTVSSGGNRPEVVQRAVEEVLAQVEEPGPERRAIRRPPQPPGGRQPLQRPDEHRELEVGVRDALGGDRDARPAEHRPPLHQLRGARLAVPGAPFGELGLEL